MHEWLTFIVVFLIVGILLDGWRRMRNARRDTIRMARKPRREEGSSLADSGYTSELPNGGARVVPKRDAPARNDKARGETSPSRIPQQVTLNLDESVPMLMESVEERTEPVIDDDPTVSAPLDRDLRREPSFSALDEDLHEDAEEPDLSTHDPEPEAGTTPAPPDEVIIINVMAAPGSYFQGAELLDALLQNGMRFGDMEIFHRHQEASGHGPVLFSLANMVKPGTFDLDTMENFQTPGVSLFLTLPLKSDSLRAFDLMRDIAQDLCDALGGELKDENRSVMTRQTMEHCRQRITDYERRRLSRAGV